MMTPSEIKDKFRAAMRYAIGELPLGTAATILAAANGDWRVRDIIEPDAYEDARTALFQAGEELEDARYDGDVTATVLDWSAEIAAEIDTAQFSGRRTLIDAEDD